MEESNIEVDLNNANAPCHQVAPHLVHNTENDFDMMYNLHQLVAMETQYSDEEVDINEYRSSVKRLMHQLLTKFEENMEYQKYLETEVDKLGSQVRPL